MKYLLKTLAVVLLLHSSIFVYAQQENTIEEYRALGYQYRVDGKLDSALFYYNEILKLNADDYDARLAAARLYYALDEYGNSEDLYKKILANDEADVEAHNGLGRIYFHSEEYRDAAFHFKKSIEYYSKGCDTYFDLARCYIAIGELDSAIAVYKALNETDNTFAESWQGIGKMYYWQGQPATAIGYYEKAAELDPENEQIQKEMLQVKSELSYQATGIFKIQSEKEETYTIDAVIQDYRLSKRISDNWRFTAVFLLDYSQRELSDSAMDSNSRWYDNSSLRADLLLSNNTISAFAGASANDEVITSYGLSWMLDLPLGDLKLSNTLTGGYDYFYYWNKVGMDFIRNELKLSYAGFEFDAQYRYAEVSADGETFTVTESEHGQGRGSSSSKTNPSQFYALGLKYEIISKPKVTIGVGQSYMDYKSQSPLYYTPSERTLYGAGITMYHSIDRWYFYGSFTQRIDNNDVENWSAGIEAGYNFGMFSVSMGGSNYNDPYYETTSAFLSIKGIF
jgi:tetratricopeptide (TPR) repeat protein